MLDAERRRRVKHDRGGGRRGVSLEVVDRHEAEDGIGVADVLGTNAVRKFERLADVRVVEQREPVTRTATRSTKNA